jgi:hypothetical protein
VFFEILFSNIIKKGEKKHEYEILFM